MDENWYTDESVWSLSIFYPDLQEDKKKEERKMSQSYDRNQGKKKTFNLVF